MSTGDQASVAAALDHLVNQFADPLSFLRELIQNSIDAGSQEVEIWFEQQQDESGSEVMIIHIEDFGEGMDREIIDSRLTRLFSSGKDGDLTKIGKFGIGFASVFALDPDAVCVDTARGGENWRVLFRQDRTFTRIERDDPIEGTKIQVIKSVEPGETERLRQRALDIVRYWCKHLSAEVRFDGEVINEPFDLDLPVKVFYREPGTEIVAGYERGEATFRGFYNTGLTLFEDEDSGYPRVSFKINSRYLEHTLTRDRVIEDVNYSKAMSRVEKLVRGPLIERLFELLDQELRDAQSDSKDLLLLQDLASRQVRREGDLPRSVAERAVARSAAGEPLTLTVCRRAAEEARLVVAEVASPLSVALQADGFVVASEDSNRGGLLTSIMGERPRRAAELFCLPLPVESEAEQLRWGPLRRAALELLRSEGSRVSELELARFDYPGSGIARWPAISQRGSGELTPLSEAREVSTSVLSRKRVLAINADHPTVRTLIDVAPREPEFAAYTLCKLFFLGTRLDPALDAELSRAAVERRLERVG